LARRGLLRFKPDDFEPHPGLAAPPLFAPMEVFDEGVEEAFQAGPDAAKDAGIDLRVSQ
jgi:hypothetical protein